MWKYVVGGYNIGVAINCVENYRFFSQLPAIIKPRKQTEIRKNIDFRDERPQPSVSQRH